MLSEATIKRLTLTRYLYGLASENSRSEREVACFAAINLLQDSIEIFLLTVADFLNAPIKPRTNFEQYIDIINQRLAPRELPFRSSLIRINKIRSSSKHDAIRPEVEEIRRLILIAREFFAEICRIIFGVEFWAISLVDQLDESETKNLLKEAEKLYAARDWINCLVRCRQAFFIEFEKSYDIKEFEDPEAAKKGIFGPFSDAPYYAKNPDYIEKNVREPYDYIVCDHAKIDTENLKYGIDSTVFWNIWRLTPQVYRHKNGPWFIKHDFDKFEPEDIQERAAYVLENTTDIILQKNSSLRAFKTIGKQQVFGVTLKREGVPVFLKADRESQIVARTPPGMTKLMTLHSSPGLKDDGQYFRVGHIEKGSFFFGYIYEKDIEGEPEPGFRINLDKE